MTHLWFETALLDDGWADCVRVTVQNGNITGIETNVAPRGSDDVHGVAIPGLPNVHSHTFQRALAGLTERRGSTDDDFWTWREQMYRLVDRLEPHDVEAIAAQAFVEMLESGFTHVGEFHYLHNDRSGTAYGDVAEMAARIAAAAQRTGIGLTLLPVFYAHSDFGGVPPTNEQRRFVTDVDSFAKLLDASEHAIAGCEGANLGVAPHSLRAVIPEQLRDVVAMAGGRPIHLHVAEQVREVNDCVGWSGARPVQWLMDHASVDSSWCLVHATHVTPDEMHGIVRRGAVVGLCPITEANLGDGIFDTASFHSAGGRFGVGSDSNVWIDAAGELRQIEYVQRLIHRRRNVLAFPSTGRTLFDESRRGGFHVLGRSVANIAVGASADIVSMDKSFPSLSMKLGDSLLDSWTFGSVKNPIDAVWRAGRKCVAFGRHVKRSLIQQDYQTSFRRLAATL